MGAARRCGLDPWWVLAGAVWLLQGMAGGWDLLCVVDLLVRGLFIYRCSFYLRLLCRSAVRRGLDYNSVRISPGVFCFLFDSPGVYVGGDWGLAPMRVEHVDGVTCGGFSTGDDFFSMFLCVGVRVRTLCELICAIHAHVVTGIGLIAIDMVAEIWRSVLSLQADSVDRDVHRNCLVRLIFHLLVCMGWCSFTPFVVLLFVDWGRTVERPVSDPADDEEMACHLLGRSTDQRHALGVPQMGFSKFVNSSSTRDATGPPFWVIFSTAGGGVELDCGDVGRRRRRLLVLFLRAYM